MFFEKKMIWLSGVMVFLLGCGSDPQSSSQDAGDDSLPPEIKSTEPSHGASGILKDAKIYIYFDEAIDRNSINNDLFFLELNQEARYGSVSYDLNSFRATLIMPAPMEPSGSYQGVLLAGVRDLKGNRMNQDYRWSFTVASE